MLRRQTPTPRSPDRGRAAHALGDLARRPLPARARGRRRAAWPRSTSRTTCGTTARSRSRCSGPSSRRSSARERFLAEIKTTANLQHPHILAAVRLGRGRRPRVLRHAVRRRREPPRPADPREAASGGRSRAHRDRGRRRARLRPPARRDPPRHQAREHPAARRPRDRGGLRHRARRGPLRRRQPHDRDRDVASARRTT